MNIRQKLGFLGPTGSPWSSPAEVRPIYSLHGIPPVEFELEWKYAIIFRIRYFCHFCNSGVKCFFFWFNLIWFFQKFLWRVFCLQMFCDSCYLLKASQCLKASSLFLSVFFKGYVQQWMSYELKLCFALIKHPYQHNWDFE